MNRIKHHVKKGDHVEVISGNLRGSTGKILQVLPKKKSRLDRGSAPDQEAPAQVAG